MSSGDSPTDLREGADEEGPNGPWDLQGDEGHSEGATRVWRPDPRSSVGRECPISLPPDRTRCCISQKLYSQPGFRVVTSLLEEHSGKRGFEVLFLPEFHTELVFIEQCGGVRGGIIVNPPLR